MEPAHELMSDEWHFMNHFLGNAANFSLPQTLYQSDPHDYYYYSTKDNSSNYAAADHTPCFNNIPLTNFAYSSQPHNYLHAQKQDHEILVSQTKEEDGDKITSTEKRSRSSNEVPMNKRNVKCKKNTSSGCSEDESHELRRVASSSSSLSQNDSTALMLSGQPSRSSRGGLATDPQSLYARKRRERINERLRILQNLVPNGTKVDISTMLEEAVQYVKFLQLQIKLLSSDDLWMYSPIAYNGINIGLELGITPTRETKDTHDIK